MDIQQGFIYKIKCLPSGKSYIGQAKEFKTKNGKPYKYGISGRWNDHTYEARRGNTRELYSDIAKYGKEQFVVEQICKAPLNDLDFLETKYIEEYKTLQPTGYNIASHSRNRHNKTISLAEFYKNKVKNAVLKKIKKNGVNHLVYIYLQLEDKKERIAFGQTSDSTYQEAYDEAISFLNKIQCDYTIQDDNTLEEVYQKKLEIFKNKKIIKVRITSASQLIAVYIKTEDSKSYKDDIRICFGGKTINKNEALMMANTFVDLLNLNDYSIVETTQQCLQQAAASMGETTP